MRFTRFDASKKSLSKPMKGSACEGGVAPSSCVYQQRRQATATNNNDGPLVHGGGGASNASVIGGKLLKADLHGAMIEGGIHTHFTGCAISFPRSFEHETVWKQNSSSSKEPHIERTICVCFVPACFWVRSRRVAVSLVRRDDWHYDTRNGKYVQNRDQIKQTQRYTCISMLCIYVCVRIR